MTSPARSGSPALPRGHVPALDGVRGLAILLVMAFYFVGNAPPVTAAGRALVRATYFGVYGFDLFFLLTGFLLTGVLLEAQGEPGWIRSFYARRARRLLPLSYATIALVVLAPSLGGVLSGAHLEEIRGHQGWVWLFGVNVFNALRGEWSFSYLDHFWSLAVGAHFILVWPLLILALGRRPRALAATCLALALGSRFASGLTSSLGASELWGMFTPLRLDGLALGSFVAVLVREPAGVDRLARWLPRVAVGAAGLLVGAALWHHFTEFGQPVLQALRSFVLVVLLACMLAGAATARQGTPVARLFSTRLLGVAGTYSYGLYVFHHVIHYYFTAHRTDLVVARWVGSPTLAMVLLALAGSAVSLALAVASHHLFEQRFLGRGSRSAQVAVSGRPIA
jgi:peptidoglycan/LPS O-acetylase OafA/YrhL